MADSNAVSVDVSDFGTFLKKQAPDVSDFDSFLKEQQKPQSDAAIAATESIPGSPVAAPKNPISLDLGAPPPKPSTVGRDQAWEVARGPSLALRTPPPKPIAVGVTEPQSETITPVPNLPPETTGTIRANSPRGTDLLKQMETDIRYGTGETLPGKVLKAAGAPGIAMGVPEGVGEIMGGPVVGPVEAAHGVGKLFAPTGGNVTTQDRVAGFNEAIGGALKTVAPALAMHPEFLVGLAKYGVGQTAISKAAQEMGADPQTAEAIANAILFYPAAKEAIGKMADIQGSSFESPEASGKGVSAFGGKARAAVVRTPEGETTVAGNVGPFKFSKKFGGKPPAGPGIEPQTIAGEPGSVQAPAPPPPDPDAALMAQKTRSEAAAEAISKGAVPNAPPPQVNPAVPAQVNGAEVPAEPAKPSVPLVRHDDIKEAVQMISQLPPEHQPNAIAATHEELAKDILASGKYVAPDGKITVVRKPEKAEDLAADALNSAREDVKKTQPTISKSEEGNATVPVSVESNGPQGASVPSAGKGQAEQLPSGVSGRPQGNNEPERPAQEAGVVAPSSAKAGELHPGVQSEAVTSESGAGEPTPQPEKQTPAGDLHKIAKLDEQTFGGRYAFVYDFQKGDPAARVESQMRDGITGQALTDLRPMGHNVEGAHVYVVKESDIGENAYVRNAKPVAHVVLTKDGQLGYEAVREAAGYGQTAGDIGADKGTLVVPKKAKPVATPAKGALEPPTIKSDFVTPPSQGGASLVPAEQKQETKYKFGNTQANIHPSSEAAKALGAARDRISDSDLAGDGKNIGAGGNHVTVRYGIQGDDTEGIKKYLESQAPFEATLGKTEKFPPSEHSDGAAPIIAPINAPDLHRMNAELEKHGDFSEPSFREYKPHATIAYVDPAKADRYTGMSVTDGKKFTVNQIAISKKDGTQEIVKLGGTTPAVSKPSSTPLTDRVKAGKQKASPIKSQRESAVQPSQVSPGLGGGLPPSTPPAKSAPETSSAKWFDTLADKEPVFAEMRRLDAKAQAGYEEARKLQAPYGRVAVGMADTTAFTKADSLGEFLRQLNKGATPEDALAAAKKFSRESAAIANSRHKGFELGRPSESTNDAMLEDAYRAVKSAAEGAPTPSAEATPPPAPSEQAAPQKSAEAKIDVAAEAASRLTEKEYNAAGHDNVLSYEIARHAAADRGLIEPPPYEDSLDPAVRLRKQMENVAGAYGAVARAVESAKAKRASSQAAPQKPVASEQGGVARGTAGKQDVSISEYHSRAGRAEYTKAWLNRQTEHNRPAIATGEELYTPGAKMKLVARTDGSGWRVEHEHDLTKGGFERALERYGPESFDKQDEWVSYNALARERSEKMKADEQAKRDAGAEAARVKQENDAAEYAKAQAFRQQLDADIKAAKFKQITSKVPVKDGEPVEVKGPSIDGLIVHKSIGRDGYDVTHIASGLRINDREFSTQGDAKVAALRLSRLGDWQRDEKKLFTDKELMKNARDLYGDMRKGYDRLNPFAPSQVDAAQSGTPSESLLKGESGTFRPGAISDAVRDYLATPIAEEHAKVKQAKDIDQGIFDLQKQNEAKQLQAVHLMRAAGGTPKDWEAIYHNVEDPTSPLTAEQQQLKSDFIDPIRARNQQLFSELQPNVTPDETHIHRVVQNSGSWLDRMLAKGKRGAGRGNVLSKSAASLKHRSMMAIEGEDGQRQVVAIKGGRVLQSTNGQMKDLGGLANGLTTKFDVQDEQLSPIADRIIDLKQQITDIPGEDRAAQIDKINERIAELEHDRDTLESVKGRAEGGQSRNAASMPARGIEISFGKRARITKQIDALTKERDTLQSATGEASITGTAKNKLDKRRADLQKAQDERTQVIATVPPSELHDSAWIDRNGKQWEITQATTREIEANTNLRYHHNALASEISENLELERAHAATQYIENLKASPEFADYAIKNTGRTGIPEGYSPTDLPQLRDYFFEKHVAEALDRFHKDLRRGDMSAIEKIGHFLTTSIFLNPLMHTPNIAVHWAVEKGKLGTGALIAPFSGTSRQAMGRAIDAVTHQNQDYIDALNTGAPLQSHRQDLADMQKLIFDKMGKELEQQPAVLKALGYANPAEWVKGWYKLSGKITWVTNDVAFMQAVYEKTTGGMSMKDAINETAKHIPDYRIPTRVLNSTMLSTIMRNPLVAQFMAYHYGALKSYGEAMKSALGVGNAPDVNPEEPHTGGGGREGKNWHDIRHGWDIMASIGVAMLGYWGIDQALRKATGDDRATIRRAGATTVPWNIYRMVEGERTPSQVAESILTPSVIGKKGAELFFNRDFRTGDPIYDSREPASEQLMEVGRHTVSSIAPVDQALTAIEKPGGGAKWLWQLAGVSFPKTNSEVTLMGNASLSRKYVENLHKMEAEDPDAALKLMQDPRTATVIAFSSTLEDMAHNLRQFNKMEDAAQQSTASSEEKAKYIQEIREARRETLLGADVLNKALADAIAEEKKSKKSEPEKKVDAGAGLLPQLAVQ